jgi:hypothetical protein
MTNQQLCGCGTCQDAWDASLRDVTKSIEKGECLLWRIAIVACMTAQCVGLVKTFFEREGQPISETDARLYVLRVIGSMADFANSQVEGSLPAIRAAYEADDAAASRKN